MKLVGEDERLPITLEPKLFLSMAEEVTKIDVEEGTGHIVQHKVAWVAIADAKDVGSDALPRQRLQIGVIVVIQFVLDLLWVVRHRELSRRSNLLEEKVQDTFLTEGTSQEGLLCVHLSDHCRVVNELDVPRLEACFHDIVAHHLQVITTRLPKPVHNLEELKHKIVLPQIVTLLEEELLEDGSTFLVVSHLSPLPF